MVEVRRVPLWAWRSLLPALALSLALMPALAGCILTADKLDPALDVPQKYTRGVRIAFGARDRKSVV